MLTQLLPPEKFPSNVAALYMHIKRKRVVLISDDLPENVQHDICRQCLKLRPSTAKSKLFKRSDVYEA
jgi:hypothetical protein